MTSSLSPLVYVVDALDHLCDAEAEVVVQLVVCLDAEVGIGGDAGIELALLETILLAVGVVPPVEEFDALSGEAPVAQRPVHACGPKRTGPRDDDRRFGTDTSFVHNVVHLVSRRDERSGLCESLEPHRVDVARLDRDGPRNVTLLERLDLRFLIRVDVPVVDAQDDDAVLSIHVLLVYETRVLPLLERRGIDEGVPGRLWVRKLLLLLFLGFLCFGRFRLFGLRLRFRFGPLVVGTAGDCGSDTDTGRREY